MLCDEDVCSCWVPNVWYVFQELIHIGLSYGLETSLTCRTIKSPKWNVVPNEMCLIMAYTTLRLGTCCHEGWTLVQQMMPVSLRVLLVQWGVMSCSRLEVTLTQPGLPGTLPRNPSPLRMHQRHKAGDEPLPVLFLFPCALPSCQGINFRFEIVRKSVPSFIIKTWLQESWSVLLALGISSQNSRNLCIFIKKTASFKKQLSFSII